MTLYRIAPSLVLAAALFTGCSDRDEKKNPDNGQVNMSESNMIPPVDRTPLSSTPTRIPENSSVEPRDPSQQPSD